MLGLCSKMMAMSSVSSSSMRAASSSMRAASSLSYSKHGFLKELGLKEVNEGVYDGAWKGSGDLFTSYDQATNEAIAQIKTATTAEYQSCLSAMGSVKK